MINHHNGISMHTNLGRNIFHSLDQCFIAVYQKRKNWKLRTAHSLIIWQFFCPCHYKCAVAVPGSLIITIICCTIVKMINADLKLILCQFQCTIIILPGTCHKLVYIFIIHMLIPYITCRVLSSKPTKSICLYIHVCIPVRVPMHIGLYQYT